VRPDEQFRVEQETIYKVQVGMALSNILVKIDKFSDYVKGLGQMCALKKKADYHACPNNNLRVTHNDVCTVRCVSV
jgi:hypothetical protein